MAFLMDLFGGGGGGEGNQSNLGYANPQYGANQGPMPPSDPGGPSATFRFDQNQPPPGPMPGQTASPQQTDPQIQQLLRTLMGQQQGTM